MSWNKSMLAQSILALIVTLFILVSFTPAVIADEAVAMVTDLIGKAIVTRQGEQKACEILMSIFAGDELRVAADSKLTLVYFKTAKEYTFAENSVVKINGEAPENKS